MRKLSISLAFSFLVFLLLFQFGDVEWGWGGACICKQCGVALGGPLGGFSRTFACVSCAVDGVRKSTVVVPGSQKAATGQTDGGGRAAADEGEALALYV